MHDINIDNLYGLRHRSLVGVGGFTGTKPHIRHGGNQEMMMCHSILYIDAEEPCRTGADHEPQIRVCVRGRGQVMVMVMR